MKPERWARCGKQTSQYCSGLNPPDAADGGSNFIFQALLFAPAATDQDRSPIMRAKRARPKSCKDDEIIAQGKRSAALGCGHQMISLFFLPVRRASSAPNRKEKEMGWDGVLPRAASESIRSCPGLLSGYPLRGAGTANNSLRWTRSVRPVCIPKVTCALPVRPDVRPLGTPMKRLGIIIGTLLLIVGPLFVIIIQSGSSGVVASLRFARVPGLNRTPTHWHKGQG
jgi:hypothetical protein